MISRQPDSAITTDGRGHASASLGSRILDNNIVLCVGIGTGNEVLRILQGNGKVNIVGVDTPDTALRKAYEEALTLGKESKVFKMDVHGGP